MERYLAPYRRPGFFCYYQPLAALRGPPLREMAAAPMTVTPLISVIIPHYNDLARLDHCLAALSSQTLPPERVEVIVADNRSAIEPAELKRVIGGRARLVDAPVPGSGPARNVGVTIAKGEIFAFTDSDCIPDHGWLEAGIAALQKADLVGGRMNVLVENKGNMTGAEAFETVFAFNNRRYVTEEFFTITANLFCSRETFDKVGPFRADMSEDKEWCLRARDKGFRIAYAEEAIVGHPARNSWRDLRSKWQRLSAESYALSMERGGGKLRWLVRTWAILPSIPIHAPRIFTCGTLSGMSIRISALATLIRLRLWRFIEGHRLLLTNGK